MRGRHQNTWPPAGAKECVPATKRVLAGRHWDDRGTHPPREVRKNPGHRPSPPCPPSRSSTTPRVFRNGSHRGDWSPAFGPIAAPHDLADGMPDGGPGLRVVRTGFDGRPIAPRRLASACDPSQSLATPIAARVTCWPKGHGERLSGGTSEATVYWGLPVTPWPPRRRVLSGRRGKASHHASPISRPERR